MYLCAGVALKFPYSFLKGEEVECHLNSEWGKSKAPSPPHSEVQKGYVERGGGGGKEEQSPTKL